LQKQVFGILMFGSLTEQQLSGRVSTRRRHNMKLLQFPTIFLRTITEKYHPMDIYGLPFQTFSLQHQTSGLNPQNKPIIECDALAKSATEKSRPESTHAPSAVDTLD
jgi:hypothetical protein